MIRQKITTVAACLSVVIFAALTFSTQLWGDEKSASTYKAKCAVCHGATGKGDTPAGKNMGVRSFADPAVAGQSDDALKATIAKGKNKMPAYGKSLQPEEIQGLVTYIRSLK